MLKVTWSLEWGEEMNCKSMKEKPSLYCTIGEMQEMAWSYEVKLIARQWERKC